MRDTPNTDDGIVLDPLDAVRAILDRPMPSVYGGQFAPRSCVRCASCDSARAEPFACAFCGFTGTPDVEGCNCATWNGIDVAEIQSTLNRRGLTNRDRKFYERKLVEALTAPERCDAAVPLDERTHSCLHGLRRCPSCMSHEGASDPAFYNDEDQQRHLLGILRDLRALLNLAGR